MSSERDSFAKGKFSTFAKGFLLHKLLLKVNYSPLRVKKSRSHDMGHCLLELTLNLILFFVHYSYRHNLAPFALNKNSQKEVQKHILD
jgi:hypothetical protein